VQEQIWRYDQERAHGSVAGDNGSADLGGDARRADDVCSHRRHAGELFGLASMVMQNCGEGISRSRRIADSRIEPPQKSFDFV
jgi:hypothetical protein